MNSALDPGAAIWRALEQSVGSETATALGLAVKLTAEQLRCALTSNCICVLLKGSIIRNDFILGYSDIDIHALVGSEIMCGSTTPKPETVEAVDTALAHVTVPMACSAIEVQLVDINAYPAEWSRILPDTALSLDGDIPEHCRSSGTMELLQHSHKHLDGLRSRIANLALQPLSPRTADPFRTLRTIGVELQASSRYALSTLVDEPINVWKWKRTDIADELHHRTNCIVDIVQFTEQLLAWPAPREDISQLRQLAHLGLTGLSQLLNWYESNRPSLRDPRPV